MIENIKHISRLKTTIGSPYISCGTSIRNPYLVILNQGKKINNDVVGFKKGCNYEAFFIILKEKI